ncbi:MAG: DUF2470 domain-containing protein [Acidimicrobiales bacterium]
MKHSDHHDPLERINSHRLDQLLAIARTFGGHPAARSVRADGFDRAGIDLTVDDPGGPASCRVTFLEPVEDFPTGVRLAFVRLARAAHDTETTNDATEA